MLQSINQFGIDWLFLWYLLWNLFGKTFFYYFSFFIIFINLTTIFLIVMIPQDLEWLYCRFYYLTASAVDWKWSVWDDIICRLACYDDILIFWCRCVYSIHMYTFNEVHATMNFVICVTKSHITHNTCTFEVSL